MRKSGWLLFVLVIVINLIISSCALSFESKETDRSRVNTNYPEKIEQPDLVDVQFNVFTSTKFSDEDLLSLDILDLVSGFQYNIERYTISPDLNNNFVISIPLPEGATISYRYSMLQPLQVNEALPGGDEVPFRQLVVRKNLVISDTISGWTNNLYTGELASLHGAVADALTEGPIPDVMISVAGKTTMTDMNGRFYLRDLPVGKHNLVATTIDGSHQSFQQEVNLVEGLSTLAIIRMTSNPEITIKFVMKAPGEIDGAPVRIAGNTSQFGMTLFDQIRGAGAQSINMPLMNLNKDGTYTAEVKAYAGTFLRYSYTLGNAVLNIERDENGSSQTRQFIVPVKDVVVKDTVIGWRSAAGSPTTFYVQAPSDTMPEDHLYIQFNQGYWSSPIPMWQMQNGQWMLVYYPSSSEPTEVEYRYCRFSDCAIGAEIIQNGFSRSFTIATQNEIHDEIFSWRMNGSDNLYTSGYNPVNFMEEVYIGVELDYVYSSQYQDSYETIIADLAENGFNWLILRQTWKVSESNSLPFIDMSPEFTIPSQELEVIASKARQSGFKVALYPHLNFEKLDTNWWRNTPKDSLWWQQWFAEYERVVTHLIKLGTDLQADQLILGGPDVWPSYPGAIETVSQNYGTPKSSEEIWTKLIEKTNQYFEGQILLAHSLNEIGAQTYSFYSLVDGLYLLVDSDQGEGVSSASVGQYLDSVVYVLYEDQKSLYIGLNAPSIQTAALESDTISNPIISATDSRYNSSNVNIQVQTQWYASYLEGSTGRDWINGIASRGFFPGIKLSDFSSSIYGKPAYQLFHNQ